MMKNKLQFSVLKWLIVLLVMAMVLFATLVHQTAFAKTDKNAHTLTINKGDTYYSVLAGKELWRNSPLSLQPIARLYLKFHAKGSLHQGVYRIPAGASLKEVVEILGKGAEVAMVKLQIIEGKTVKDLYNTLKNTDGINLQILTPKKDGYTWADVAIDNKAVSESLGIQSPNGNLEGYFAPDTYFFAQGTSDKVILQRLYDTQKNILNQAWQNRAENLPYQTPYEALIMASIIEKETGIKSERNNVSAVFANRFAKKMRLQTDPTIIYGLFDRYDGKIYKSNIAERTDYNTYQIDGLPPTPIALPSAEAIQAALHPSDVDYLYFVATGKGGHKFSKTLAEHEQAVGEYRAIKAQNESDSTQ